MKHGRNIVIRFDLGFFQNPVVIKTRVAIFSFIEIYHLFRKFYVMFWFFASFLIIVAASSILQNPNELTNIENYFDAVVPENSLVTSQANCRPSSFLNNDSGDSIDDDEDAIYRRDASICPATVNIPAKLDFNMPVGNPTVPDQPEQIRRETKNEYGKVESGPDLDPCAGTINSVLVTCGGPEKMGLRVRHTSMWSPYVANCVPGKSFHGLIVSSLKQKKQKKNKNNKLNW